jgi:hypothetical protein
MLYHTKKKNLCKLIDPDRIDYGEGRGETGICLHLPLKNHIAGNADEDDKNLMIDLTNAMIEYLLYKRPKKGPELWDYDGDKANETYRVCGDNPTTSGITVFDTNYEGGSKLQVVLEKTFGANEISIRWKSNMVGDDTLLKDLQEYLISALRNNELVGEDSDGS